MSKLFVCSDIHSAYTPWMEALSEAEFDENNDNHKIIVCGDLFDRMDESQQVYDFTVDMIDKDKLIYVFGNHELLLLDCLKRKYPGSHDWHNGTAQTVIDLAPNADTFVDACDVVYAKIKPLFDKAVNYFETEHYVFCHGFIPVNCDDYCRKNPKFSKKEDWRYAHQSEWDDAMWLNGMKMAMDGFTIEKCIVVGHYHTSWGHAIHDKTFNEFGEGADFSPFYYEDKLIAIDGCVAHTGKVNVLVLEDEFI